MSIKNILLSQLAFLGLGALAGGGALIISPSGELIGMPLTLLAHSPFNNFLLPAIILFIVFGILPLLLMFALVKKPQNRLAQTLNLFSDLHWAWTFTIYIAIALVVWIQLEMEFLSAISWLHTFYVCYGLTMIFVALLPGIRNNYTK
jgi:hypothetical protein